MQKAPENRLNTKYAQEIIRALRDIEQKLGTDTDGAVIIKGNDVKFWCTVSCRLPQVYWVCRFLWLV